MIDQLPATPAAEQHAVRALGEQELARRRGRVIAGLSVSALAVVCVGAIVTGALSVSGTGECVQDDDGEVCVRRAWWPFTIQQRAAVWTLAGEPHGPRIEWHRNGEVWFSDASDHGRRAGLFEERWPNGVTRFVGTYVDGSSPVRSAGTSPTGPSSGS